MSTLAAMPRTGLALCARRAGCQTLIRSSRSASVTGDEATPREARVSGDRARRWTWAALVVGIALGVSWLALPPVGAAVLGWALTRATGESVAIARLGIGWRPFVLELQGVRVARHPDAPPTFRAARVLIEAPPGALLHRAVRLRRVEVERPWIDTPRSTKHTTRDQTPPLRWTSLHVGRLDVTGGHVARGAGAAAIHLHDLTASAVAWRSGHGRTAMRFRADVAFAGGATRVRVRRNAGRIRMALDANRLGLRPFGPLLPAGLRAERATGRLRWRPGRAGGDLAIDGLRVELPSGWRARLDGARLTAIHADLARHVAHIGAVAGRDGTIVAGAASSVPTWAATADVLSLARVRLGEAGHPASSTVSVSALVARGVSTIGARSPVVARVAVGDGGQARARGTIDLGRPAVDGRVKLRAVALGAILGPLTPGLAVSGDVTAAFALSAPPVILSHGTLALDRVTVTAGDQPILGWHHLETDVTQWTLAPRRVAFRQVVVDSPYLVLRREAAGLEPLARLATLVPPPVPTGDAPPPPEDLDSTVVVRDGTLLFEDRLVDPPYRTALRDLDAVLHRAGGPQPRRTDVTADAHVDGTAPLHIAAVLDPERRLSLTLADLPLVPLRPYIERLTGWAPTAGTLTLTGTLELRGGTLTAPSRLVVAGVGLEKRGDDDPLATVPSVPLERALTLARIDDDPVALDLQLGGTLDTAASDLAASLRTALRDAMADAVTRPLREPGAAPAVTIPAAAGRDTLVAPAAETLDRLAVLLAREPTRTVTLAGRTGSIDASAMRDHAVLEQLAGEPDTAERRALTRRLQASAEPAPVLTRAQGRRLAQLQRAATPSPAALATLARARAARVEAELRDRYAPAMPRVRAGDAAPGAPGVVVTIGGPRPRAD
jgi:uncharacterized protein DUF748